MIHTIINKTKYGDMMYLHNDCAFSKILSEGKIFEENLIETVLSPIIKNSKIILDIGSHCGSHAIIYSKINPSSKIYCFEPQKKMFEILRMNVKINDIDNIQLFNFALGNKKCCAYMSDHCLDGPNMDKKINDKDFFNYGGLQIGLGGENINIEVLDKVLDEILIEKIDYIKIDVEGFENFVVDGGMKMIIRDKPIIFFEHNYKAVTKDMSEFYEPVEWNIINKLVEIGYNVTKKNDDNWLAIYENSSLL
jgi:FkbM family methyltransferase